MPAICTTLSAQLATSNEQFSSSAESSPPDTSRIQAALNSCSGTGKAVVLAPSGSDNAFLAGQNIVGLTPNPFVAATVAGPALVSTDPAGGIGTWASVSADTMPNPGTASCTTGGACAVSGVGTFTTSALAAGPGIVGFPLPGVSCVSVNFCFALEDNQLEAGTGSG